MSLKQKTRDGWSGRLFSYRRSACEFLSRRWTMVFLTIVPAISLFMVITLLPIGWSVFAGLYEIPLFSPKWTFVGLGNYRWFLENPTFFLSLWNGAIFAVGGIIVQVAFGTGVALVVNREMKYKTIIQGIVFLPYMIPTAILSFIALWMNNSTLGVTNQILLNLGVIQDKIAFYGNPEIAMASVIGTFSWRYTFFVTIMVLARLQSIPDNYYESASMAGAGMYQQFRDITLPNLKGVLFIVLLLRTIWNFNKFDIIWVLTQGGPQKATYTAPVLAYDVAFRLQSLGKAAALSTMLFGILVVGATIYFWKFEPSEEVRVE